MSLHSQQQSKLVTAAQAANRCEALRAQGKKIVFTNGCFDILHPGHVDYLAKARDLGDFLVLGLNTDASVKRLEKAGARPVNNELSRAMVLAALASVDLIVLFDETTPYDLIGKIGPDVLVKGNDYKIDEIAGHDIVQARGGSVVTVPLLEGYSTTSIIKKIKSE
jgi:D-glycero-beta-D-manno-heptose 1-phosphate adenylyltransferase